MIDAQGLNKMNSLADVGMTCNANAPETRRERVAEMHDAIEYMDTIKNRIEGIADRINGSDTPECGNTLAAQYPSLADMLSSGPQEIRSKCDYIHERLDLIESLLF